MFFVIVSLILLVSYFILNYCHRRSSIKTENILPGPKAFPLIGSAYYFLRRSSDEFLNVMIKLINNYPSPFKLLMGNKLFIVIHKAKQIQEILENNKIVEKNILYKFIEPVFGKGLLTAPELIWIKNRKIIAPNFSTIALQKFFYVFVEQSLILTDQLEKIGLNRKKIILHNHIAKYALSTACSTMTDIKMEFLSDEINQCLEVIASLRNTFKSRVRNPFLYFDLIFNLTAVGREQRKAINFLHSFINKIIQQHMYALNEEDTNCTEYQQNTTHKTLLQILLSHKYPQEMIHDNLITMILAGFDTTAVTIDFAIFMLANFPSIQEKVYQELWQIYETKTPKSAPIKYEDLQHMDYLDRVIKETMRLFPAVPLIGRYLTEDVKIGEFILPKGTEVFLAILTLHRNEKYWPNPLIFDPDRFLPEKGTSNKYYMPFSSGRRNCIGMKYAMISMKVILAILIRTFVFKVEKITQIDAIKLDMDITLHNIEPMEVIIKRRELH
ncbi:cytochrome P450 4V2 [Camponotus floridanus]|nr:cytochrome P450 4V2 [Camponotus floridanus]